MPWPEPSTRPTPPGGEAAGSPLEHAGTFRLLPGVAWSDHCAFWRQGYRAFMATDTAFYRSPYYHDPGDTPDKLACAGLAGVTEGLGRVISRLAQGRDPLQRIYSSARRLSISCPAWQLHPASSSRSSKARIHHCRRMIPPGTEKLTP